MKYIINTAGIVFFYNGKPIKVEKSSGMYPRLIKAFDLPEEEQENAIMEVLEQVNGNFEKDGFEIRNDEVFYQGERLPTVLADKVRSIAQEGLPVKLFAKFWENLQQNPSASSVRELYDFLAYKELPITEDGCFLAYKGLTSDGWSISGNKKTKVLQGKVDGAGRIYNGVGETIEVRRYDVDDNRSNHCSFGLHVGSLEYAEDFAQGQVVIVKVNPKDVVSVPDDCSCQKCRVSQYKVVDAFESEIKASITDENGEEISDENSEEYEELLNGVQDILRFAFDNHKTYVTVSDIQDDLYRYYSEIRILDAVDALGYSWSRNENGEAFVLV